MKEFLEHFFYAITMALILSCVAFVLGFTINMFT